MPFSFEFNAEHRLLRLVGRGNVTDAEVRGTIPASRRAVEAYKPTRAIIDLTHVSKFDVSTQTIQHIAHNDPPFADLLRYYVAPSDYLFGLSRMFQILVGEERPNLRVVRTWAEACHEMRLPENMAFEPLPGLQV